MRGRVVGEHDLRHEARSLAILIVRQQFHTAIPIPPKNFYNAVAPGVVDQGGGESGLGDSCESCQKFGHELWGLVAVEGIRRSMTENDLVQKWLYESLDRAVRRAMTVTNRAVVSMIPRASVSPVVAVPWPWKSIANLVRGAS